MRRFLYLSYIKARPRIFGEKSRAGIGAFQRKKFYFRHGELEYLKQDGR